MKSHLFNFLLLATIIAGFALASPLAAFPYRDNGNGTVTDQKSGFVWQRCSMGKNNDASCSGTAVFTNYANAMAYCENLILGGRSDWRLPNIKELKSIVKDTVSTPSIDTIAFPGTLSGLHWSSSTCVANTALAWNVNFNRGSMHPIDKTINRMIRCVSTGP